MADKFEIKFLPDGRVKFSTDEIGQENHLQAENVLKFLAEKLGHVTVENKVGHAHAHEHAHDKETIKHGR